jgi:hypothetical protein
VTCGGGCYGRATMTLTAIVTDPLTQPAPPAWGRFAADAGLLPVWHPELMRRSDWCTQLASSMVLVTDAGGAPVAAFHARHLGATSPRRFARPGVVAPFSMTEVRSVPVLDSGVAFSPDAQPADRAEAVRVFERSLRGRVGAGGRFIGYRGLPAEHVPAVPTRGRKRLQLSPRLVVHNAWSDRAGYVASLPRKWRSQLKKIRNDIENADNLRVALEDAVEPDQASWLAYQVRSRHQPRATIRPPQPVGYFEAFNALPGAKYVTYRDASARLIAFCTVYDTGEEIRPGTWGLRAEADGGQRNLYFDQYLRMVELMIDRGRSRLILGPGMVEIKTRYGATPEPRWGVVGLR